MKYTMIFIMSVCLLSCKGQISSGQNEDKISKDGIDSTEVDLYYLENQGDESASISLGVVSKGSLKNGKLIPFQGTNFTYFDSTSYLSGRAFTNDKLKTTLLSSYLDLEKELPGRNFCIMECSNEHGGEIFPHRTHQNGLSVDFMMPLIRDNEEYYGLDSLGKSHYFLEFDHQGRYSEDKSIEIDFDLVARHILILESNARANGLKIAKVIINTELKDELLSTTNGKKLAGSGIYIVKSLTPLINSLHDDHYHIDFEQIK